MKEGYDAKGNYWTASGRAGIICVECSTEFSIGDVECKKCGTKYCAKNRQYIWIDRPKDLILAK